MRKGKLGRMISAPTARAIGNRPYRTIFVLFFLSIFFLRINVHASPNINAPIAVIMCFDTGDILYDRNMNQRWIPASMTKIMTAFLVYEEIGLGNLSLDTEIRVSENAARISTDRRIEGSFVPLQANTYITVENLLRLIMLPSSNGATIVVAEHISGSEEAFVIRMNETAESLGMYASFTNTHGAFIHHSNAYSIALLIRTFIQRYPDILRITAMPSMNFNGQFYNNTNWLVRTASLFDGADGFKTGTIRAAGWGHSTTAIRDNRRIIAVLMNTANNSERQSQSRVLLEYGFTTLTRLDIERAERVRIFLTGRPIILSEPAIARGNKLFLPLDCFGFSVDIKPQYLIATADNHTFFIDRHLAIINGEMLMLDTPVKIINNILYVSLCTIAKITNTIANWDMTTGVVQLRGDT